jgi:hypothetical protein
MFDPGSMGDPFAPGSPGVATSGAQNGGPFWIGVRGPVGATPVPAVAGITPGDSTLAILTDQSSQGQQTQHSNSSGPLGLGGGTYPS